MEGGMTEWLKDGSGNKCSVEYFGSEEAAQKALDSLKLCENCTDCSRCSRCSRCSGCSGCSGCSDCSDCWRCSRCWGCSGCSDCSGCSYVAWLDDRQNLKGDSSASPGEFGPPPVPVIENIHQRVYEAASSPEALAMDTWHT